MKSDDYLLCDLSAGGGGPVPPWDDEDEEGGDGTDSLRSPTPPAEEPDEAAVYELPAGYREWLCRSGRLALPEFDPFARERALPARCTGGCTTVAEAMEYARQLRQRRGDE